MTIRLKPPISLILVDLYLLTLILRREDGTFTSKISRCNLRQENYMEIAHRNYRSQGLQNIYYNVLHIHN
jgi:hypothetical protein